MKKINYRELLYKNYNQTSSMSGKQKSPTPKYFFFKKIIQKYFPKNKEIAILDLGCGHGFALKTLQQLGYHNCCGVDYSSSQIEQAHLNNVTQAIQGDLFVHLRTLKDASVDVITSFDLLEHLSKIEVLEVTREIFRVLSTGGMWVIHTVNAESPFFGRILYGDYTHEHAFTKRSISQLMFAHGFKSVSCYEDKPIIHNIKSFFRRILFGMIRFIFQAILTTETGETKGIFSQNFLSIINK